MRRFPFAVAAAVALASTLALAANPSTSFGQLEDDPAAPVDRLDGQTTADPRVPDPLVAPEQRHAAGRTFLDVPRALLDERDARRTAFLAAGHDRADFPRFARIWRFWQACGAAMREAGPAGLDGGLALAVLGRGLVATAQDAVAGVYEGTLGRLADALSGTAAGRAEHAWTDASTRAARDIADRLAPGRDDGPGLVAVALSHAPPTDAARDGRRVLMPPVVPGGVELDAMPGGDTFTSGMLTLAAAGADIRSIAGTRGDVVVAVRVPQGWRIGDPAVREWLTVPDLERPGMRQAWLATPVAHLGPLLRAFSTSRDVDVERIHAS